MHPNATLICVHDVDRRGKRRGTQRSLEPGVSVVEQFLQVRYVDVPGLNSSTSTILMFRVDAWRIRLAS